MLHLWLISMQLHCTALQVLVLSALCCVRLVKGREEATHVSKTLYIRTIQCSDVNTCRQNGLTMLNDFHHGTFHTT